MDHQTLAQLLGNYGEFLGAIAVVIGTTAHLCTVVFWAELCIEEACVFF